MSKPIKTDDEIIDRIIERFSSIKRGEEFYYTYSSEVYENKSPFEILKTGKCAISIREIKEEFINEFEENSKMHECVLWVDIDLFPGTSDPKNLREMKADILKSIAEDLTWGKLALTTKYISTAGNFVFENDSDKHYATIKIKIIYRKKAWSKK